METVISLLNFNFDIHGFSNSARSVISPDTGRHLKQNIEHLKRISDSSVGLKLCPIKDADELCRDFYQAADYGLVRLKTDFSSVRQLRKLAWSLGYTSVKIPESIVSSIHLAKALELLEGNCRTSMILGVFSTLIQKWAGLSDTSRSSLMKFIAGRVREYQGGRQRIRLILTHYNYYLQRNGPAVLSIDLIRNQIPPRNVWEYLFLPKDFRCFSYFEEFIIHYVKNLGREKRLQESLKEVVDALREHISSLKGQDVSKIVLSELINQTQNSITEDQKIFLRAASFQLIGDPNDIVSWSLPSSSEPSLKEKVERARLTLNEWLAREFIETFFDNPLLAIDRDRKQFWLKYSKHMENVKLYTTDSVSQSLKMNERLKPFFASRVCKITGSGQMSALVFCVKGYILVEFSQTGGAFYAYQRDNKWCPRIDKNVLGISELRRPRKVGNLKELAFHGVDYLPEGRHPHLGDWQYHLSQWIGRYLQM